MNDVKRLSRVLGAAFLLVDVTSLAGGVLLGSVAGGVFASTSISAVMVNVANQVAAVRVSILADLATSVGEIALAALLYSVLRKQGPVLALVALGCWLGEALSLAISKIGLIALIPLSQEFVRAGEPANSYYQALGDVLYSGVTMRLGATTQMLFYCVGGLLWYFLFFRSRFVPRAISVFGLTAVSAGLVGIVSEFAGGTVPAYVYMPILPFELLIGGWLLVRGVSGEQKSRQTPATSHAVVRRQANSPSASA